jgi:hypothetical protein
MLLKTLACVGLLSVTTAIADAQNVPPVSVAVPKVVGPVAVTPDSYPFLAAGHDLPVIDLRRAGYVEQEFFVSGVANVYEWTADGTLSIKTPNAPYTTRILVRRPADPNRFSGSVIVEPLFPARRWDWSMMWGYSHDYMLEHGDAWVGITLPASIGGLQKFNSTRYAALSFKNPAPEVPCGRGNTASDIEDGLRWDAISQVGALLKAANPGGPLNGLRPAASYLTSQGGDLTTYMNAIHSRATLANGKPVYDGYLAKAPFNAARINQCAAPPPPGDPRHVVKNVGVPVIAVAAQGEVLGTFVLRRPDNDEPRDRYRLYEVAGAGHIDKFAYIGFPSMEDQRAAGNAFGTPEWPFAARCDPDVPLMDVPIMTVAFNAAFANLDRWVRTGTPAPNASRIAVKDAGPEAGALGLVTDEFGHGLGGVRTPYIDVPVASYATNSTGPGTCREMGHTAPFDAARIAAVYGDARQYSARVAAAVDRLVKERWLTEGDARRVKSELVGKAGVRAQR